MFQAGLSFGGDDMKRLLAWFLALVLLGGCGSGPECWRSYGGDGSRGLSSRERGPDKPRLAWVTDLGAKYPGVPVVDDGGNIYVPHSGGSVTKVNHQGEIQWRFDSWVSGSGILPPWLSLLPDNKVLMSTQGKEETFLLSSSGETLVGPEYLPWPASLSPAVTSKGYAVVCHQYVDGASAIALRVYGIGKGGEALWKRDFAAKEQSFSASNPVVLEDGRAFVFVETETDSNFLIALGAAGDILWQTEFPQGETRGVALAIAASQEGIVFFGTPRLEDILRVRSPGCFYAVGTEGQVLWRVNAGQRVEQIFLAPGLVVANVLRTKLLAVNLQGEKMWEYSLSGWESNGVMDSRGRIFMAGVLDNSIRLRAVDSRGRDVWEFDTRQRGESISYLALANGTIYLATDTGKLLAISK